MAGEAMDDAAYREGYEDMMRMHAEAQRRGWHVPERIIVREIMRLEHSATPPAGDRLVPMVEPKPYPPGWYRGRAAALRAILRDLHQLSR